MAPTRNSLRAVSPDEKPRRTKPKTLAEVVEGGEYVEILRAQRRDIVTALPDERGPAKAALHRQLALISKEIEALEARAKQAADEDGTTGAHSDEAWDSEAL